MASPTQSRRVLAALKGAGGRGLTQADWLRQPTPDLGPPITRMAARVNELRELGYRIESRGRRDRCTIYVLTGAVTLEELRDQLVDDLDEAARLFDAHPVKASTSHYDVEVNA